MAKLTGITVQLTVKTQTTANEIGEPVYTSSTATVDNVLVAPASAQEIVDSFDLYGKKAVYKLGIPKGDTHTWEDTDVTFFGQTFHTIGPVTEGIEHLIPLDWNRTIQVEKIES